ncbi:MAG: hypothetical protein O2954_01295 [bacterium]|nr:hypothetical protein [bacterium]
MGLGTILLGYLCLAQPPVDGFLLLSLAPVLLVIGYCVLIPLALLMDPTRIWRTQTVRKKIWAISSAG